MKKIASAVVICVVNNVTKLKRLLTLEEVSHNDKYSSMYTKLLAKIDSRCYTLPLTEVCELDENEEYPEISDGTSIVGVIT